MGGQYYDGDDVSLKDGNGTPVTSSNPLRIDPTGTTTQPVSGTVAVSNFPLNQYIKGATTDTLIGNTGDRLLVDASFSSPPTTAETELPTFVAHATDVAIGNGKSMLSLVNTSGSTVKVRIREIRIISTQTVAVTGINSIFQLLRCVSHSGGTSVTPYTHDTTDTLSVSVTARTGATIGTESAVIMRKWNFSTDEFGVGAIDVESSQHDTMISSPMYQPYMKTKPITLNANEGITIKQTVNSTVGTFDILVLFTQE